MILECIRYMKDDENPHEKLEEMDIIYHQQYDSGSFFEHVIALSEDIFESTDLDDMNRAYMFLALANMKLIQE